MREGSKAMKVFVLNGSPRKHNTDALVGAFVEGAQEAGHEVEVLKVAKLNIAGCKACEYCRTKGEGTCIQKDDMEQVIQGYMEADVVVLASPIYYFTMTAQIEAAIQRVFCIGKPAKAKKAALLLSSGSPGVYDAAVAQFKGYTAYTGIEAVGVITANGSENKSEAKLNEIREFAKSL